MMVNVKAELYVHEKVNEKKIDTRGRPSSNFQET